MGKRPTGRYPRSVLIVNHSLVVLQYEPFYMRKFLVQVLKPLLCSLVLHVLLVLLIFFHDLLLDILQVDNSSMRNRNNDFSEKTYFIPRTGSIFLPQPLLQLGETPRYFLDNTMKLPVLGVVSVKISFVLPSLVRVFYSSVFTEEENLI